ncbi:MAG: chemotaxis protein CheD [Pseudomonadota bacterium]
MRASGQIDIFLQPGEYFLADANYRICTLLGSCVSITLWHPRLRVGAMSHFLLSSRPTPPAGQPNAHYGDEALWLMAQELDKAKVPLKQCEAKIFGGGNMFPKQLRGGAGNIGQQNGETARRLLRQYQIPVVSESLFGVGHRKIIFNVGTGHVWSRQMKLLETGAP